MNKRVLIMSASAGTGHVRAAEALSKKFSQCPYVSEVIHEDALKYTNKLFRDFYSKLYTNLVLNAPDFLGIWYRASDEPWKTDAMRHMLDRLNTGPLMKFIGEFRPDITVCTHFMPAGIISHLMSLEKLSAHLSIVVTDLDFHAMWLSRLFHRYFVAIEETKVHLETLGLPSERITVSGIPVDPVFANPAPKKQAREVFGLDPDRPTLLLSGGALGVGPAEMMVTRLLELKTDAQTLVVCGKSEQLLANVREIAARAPGKFKVFGYTDKMHTMMAAADLYVGKPGGLTTAEAMASGLPMVIVAPIPGQEERNSDHLLEDGVAIKCNELTTMPWKIDQLLADPERLASMRRKALALGRPDAADMIVRTLVNEESMVPLKLGEAAREAIAQKAAKEVEAK